MRVLHAWGTVIHMTTKTADEARTAWITEHDRLALVLQGFEYQAASDPAKRAARKALLAHNNTYGEWE